MARATGTYGIVVGHSEDGKKSRVRLPSGSRKTLSGSARAMIGVIAAGGRTDKPVLKAGNAFHKHKAKGRGVWPRIRGNL